MQALEYPGSEALVIEHGSAPGTTPLVRPKAIIKADRLSYLIGDVANFNKQEEFMNDFGMLTHSKTDKEIYLHGYDGSP